jgi:hypothetical protein
MPANNYHFSEQWTIPGFTPEQVYEVLANAALVTDWWSGVYLEVEPLGRYTRPVVGGKVRTKARGWLPYTLDFVLEALVLEPGRVVEVKASGDFEGIWRAELVRDGDGTKVLLDWRVEVQMPLIRLLSPVLKPIFAWNHRWTTPRGEQGLCRYLRAKHGRLPALAGAPAAASAPAELLPLAA